MTILRLSCDQTKDRMIPSCMYVDFINHKDRMLLSSLGISVAVMAYYFHCTIRNTRQIFLDLLSQYLIMQYFFH